MTDREIRLMALHYATAVASPSGTICNLLVHAQWVERFINSGQMPEIEGPADHALQGGLYFPIRSASI